MRKIIIELHIDWEGYEDVSDELIVEDAIEAKVDGVGWTLLRQPPVIKSVCEHRNYRAGHSPFVPCICNDCGEEL